MDREALSFRLSAYSFLALVQVKHLLENLRKQVTSYLTACLVSGMSPCRIIRSRNRTTSSCLVCVRDSHHPSPCSTPAIVIPQDEFIPQKMLDRPILIKLMQHEPNPQTKHTVKVLYGVLTAGLQLSLAVLTYILTSKIKGAASFPLFSFLF